MKTSAAAASPASTETWALFLTAHSVLVGAMEKRLKDAGLPPLAWYDVLWILERAPDQRLRMSALADQLVLTRFNVTRLVDRLVEAGLVARRQTKEDGRGFYAVPTEKGRALRKQMWTVYRPAIVELFNQHLSSAQHADMQSVMRRLLERDVD
ncbi:MAG TPA: MarR family transcriptional regulator [Rudaea sp.]|nr:MarR family transcriptional regulator [Rudaea sp.]